MVRHCVPRSREPGISQMTPGIVSLAVRRWRQPWWLLGLFAALLVLLAVAGPDLVSGMRYERSAVLDGEWWRLFTAHLVHGSVQHLLLNIAGLAVMAGLFRGIHPTWCWLAAGLASACFVGLGLLRLNPEVDWYLGLSGVLHGLLVVGGMGLATDAGRRWTGFAILALTAVKLGWEQMQGAMQWAGSLAVIVDAHLYGAIGGLPVAAALIFRRRPDARD